MFNGEGCLTKNQSKDNLSIFSVNLNLPSSDNCVFDNMLGHTANNYEMSLYIT